MKVAIITNTCYEEIVPLTKYLSKKITVDLYTVISSRGSGVSLLFEDPKFLQNKQKGTFQCNKENFSKVFQSYIDDKFKIFVLYFKSLAYLHPTNLFTALKVSKIIKEKRYDLIHFNVLTPLVFIIKILLKDIPSVITIHDPVPHTGEDNINKKFNNFFIKRFSNIPLIFHSKYSLNLFSDKYQSLDNHRFNYIPFGIHEWISYYNENIHTKKNSILFFGRISPYKGIKYLIEAGKIASEKIENIKITIAGKGQFDFDVSELYNDSRFKIINRYIENQELARLIASHSVIVCPYTDATQSGVLMSAYAFNKPVIATRVGNFPNIIRDNLTGFLVSPKNSIKLAEAIIKIFSTPNLINKMEKNITQDNNVGINSWQSIAQKTYKVYRSVLEK